ncbi:hypothetical protein GHT06_001764 [Daphnia sinensis]|uniref:RRM domain-containing protein n=1 Tax=Daphnia sinensis TaxID=1820382 RepID=A0AAD5PM70_9CRUS|nr:hypothetical protein GHT06_001764 [Daphnia sinensis]
MEQGRCQYTAVYNNAQAASYAKEKLYGFEYSPGHRLIVKFDYINAEPSRSTSSATLPTTNVQTSVQYAGLNCLTPVGSGTRLPFLSGLQGQGGMENNVQPVPTTNPSPVGAPYHGLITANNAARTAALHNNLATLAETIAQATSLIQAASGLGQGFLQSPSKHAVNGTDERHELMGHLEMLGALSNQGIPLSRSQAPTNNNYSGETYDPSYCSVKLPTPQPLAPMDSSVGERLFIVCQPTPPPIYVLKDIFGRFGHLIDVYMLGGRS